MIDFSFSIYDLEYFLLIFVRVSCFVYIAPYFGMNDTPARIRIGISAFTAILLYETLTPVDAVVFDTVMEYAVIVMKEAIAGLLIGFGANICMAIVNFAGSIADMETGLSMATLMDPATRESTSITGVLYQYSFMLMLIASGMYRYLFGALADSFVLIPVNGVVFHADSLLQSMIEFMNDYIMIGFRIVLPIFCATLLLNAILGVLAKVSPQMNMFAVGIQLKVLTGLAAMFLTAGMLPGAADFVYQEMKKMVVSFIGGMMSLEYNLQFFAAEGQGGEKTEPATEKKLTDARKEGQVAKSREIANGLGLLAVFLVLKLWVGHMGYQFINVFSAIYEKIPEVVTFWHGNMPQTDANIAFRDMMLESVIIMAPILLIGFAVAFLSDVVQVGWHPTGKPMQPKFSKLSPVSGFKRIFSVNSVVELIKSLLRIGLIIYICYNYLKDKWPILYTLYDMDLTQAIALIGETVTDLGIRISLIYMIIAAADFIYQKYKFSKDMRMTKQEIKEEYKQQEGDPQVKGRIRQKMREVSQRRMMQNLPQADVVITNPTHYAVAIKYDPEVAEAPIVIAKGADNLAAKIKEIAREHKIEIVENKPLARMLYANVDVGQAVPPELYQAVAEVLAFVYHLQGKV